jgi:outer membrane lipoprotein carrier protein
MSKFFILILFATNVFAAPLTVDDVFHRMTKAKKGIRTLEFDFIQTAIFKDTGEKQEVVGHVSFRPPHQFRLEKTSPRPSLVVSDGKTLWMYDAEKNHVFKDDAKNGLTPSQILQDFSIFSVNVLQIKKGYNAVLEESDKGPLLILTPKEEALEAPRMRIWVDGETGLPSRTEMESPTLLASMDFKQVRLNAPLSSDSFRFKENP